MSTWNLLLKHEDLGEESKRRSKATLTKTISLKELELAVADGWVEKKRRKRTVTVEKSKALGDSFEDEVWTAFYRMGFDYMNSTNKFELSYSSSNPALTKQIDVIAMDDETCLFVECKEICDEITSKFGRKKFKYIFATRNYVIGQTDLDRIRDFNFAYFDEDSVKYYDGLATHLGTAAKYQLLGSLFAGKEIKGLDMNVPAIEGN